MMDLPVELWADVFDLLPANAAGAQDHLHLALVFRNARSASLERATFYKAKFLEDSLKRLAKGLDFFPRLALLKSLLFVSLFPSVVDEAQIRQEMALQDANGPRQNPATEEARVQEVVKQRLLRHIRQWHAKLIEFPTLPNVVAVEAVHDYLHMLLNKRPFGVVGGNLHRVEIDAKDSKLRKQVYKDTMDCDTDMLIWRYRDVIGEDLINDIYRDTKYPRNCPVWAWWELHRPRGTYLGRHHHWKRETSVCEMSRKIGVWVHYLT